MPSVSGVSVSGTASLARRTAAGTERIVAETKCPAMAGKTSRSTPMYNPMTLAEIVAIQQERMTHNPERVSFGKHGRMASNDSLPTKMLADAASDSAPETLVNLEKTAEKSFSICVMMPT